jgi:hypothetical protein
VYNFDSRSALYWALRQMFEADEVVIGPLGDVLAALWAIKWTVDSRRRIGWRAVGACGARLAIT